MAGITGTLVKKTEFSGQKVIAYITAPVTAEDDTITLTQATHGVSSLDFAIPIITAGFDAAFTHVEASVSGLVITLNCEEADGTDATDFTATTIGLLIVGSI